MSIRYSRCDPQVASGNLNALKAFVLHRCVHTYVFHNCTLHFIRGNIGAVGTRGSHTAFPGLLRYNSLNSKRVSTLFSGTFSSLIKVIPSVASSYTQFILVLVFKILHWL